MKENTLIVHQGALGDLIVTLNALTCIRDVTHIDIYCRPSFIPLLQYLNIARRVFSVEQREFISLFSGEAPQNATSIFTGYHTILLFSYSSGLADSIQKAAQCPVFQIPPRPEPAQKIHVTEFLIRHLCSIYPDANGHLKPMPMALIRGKSRFSKEVLIHPGSGSTRKNWPLKYFIQVGRFLLDNGFQPKWVIGPAENFMISALEKNGIADTHMYLNEDLVETTIRLSRAVGFIGNDSGLTHLSAFVGQRTLTIFGPSDHQRWRPTGPKAVAVIPEPSCPPCFETGPNNCDTMTCLNSISVDTVIEAIKINGFI